MKDYIITILKKFKKQKSARTLSSPEAYKIWATFYDNQPDNVVLYLEGKLFTEMISQNDISNKKILDIGCGTGRHWNEMLKKSPLKLTGMDNSEGMINKLKEKFPSAEVFISKENSLKLFDNSVFDIIVSTLTIGHVKDIKSFLHEWNRVLKTNGAIIITDFHPEAFGIGMKRTFLYKGEVIEVENYLYTMAYLKKIFEELNWEISYIKEKVIDEEVKYLFEKQNYMKA